jgi:hypothetical protein
MSKKAFNKLLDKAVSPTICAVCQVNPGSNLVRFGGNKDGEKIVLHVTYLCDSCLEDYNNKKFILNPVSDK